jgi:hypothetical protein
MGEARYTEFWHRKLSGDRNSEEQEEKNGRIILKWVLMGSCGGDWIEEVHDQSSSRFSILVMLNLWNKILES